MVAIHTLRFFQKQSLRKTVFETLFFKSVANTLQTLCFANKVIVLQTHRRYTTGTLFRKYCLKNQVQTCSSSAIFSETLFRKPCFSN